ncbi:MULTISPECIES: VIT domain-containing protein [unclassified Stenotrophomonas]|uniref:VIT domain-containing protein n=1 Tax=unclassified Stenotrophomonas TaxID=196198 RepID=UPI000D1555E3|nr:MULTISPECIES: VIT domain-containing protein [unclassified Stenotrophomonas]PTA70985.1 trypsin [Stenotrophomonas sp. Nf1]PTA81974.1 trypsin [Stenotrophomonas sp. Nf4]
MPLVRHVIPSVLALLLCAVAGVAQAQSAKAVRPVRSVPLLQVAGAEQPIALRQARIEGDIQAGIAQTRITLEFHNPNRRVLEGELQFPLAEGQQITGFALDIGGELREAVPVPKDRGRQVFEDIARRGVDPGLLEQTAGNQFRLRIYPLPAGGSRRVQLVLREPLAFSGQGWRWTLPLQFAAGAASVAVKVQAPGAMAAGTAPFQITAGRLRWQGQGSQLPPQLQWTLPAERKPQVQVAPWQDGHYLLAQVPVPVSGTSRTPPSEVGLLWDGSGSSGRRDRAREFALLDRYFAAMGNGTVALTVLRDRAEPVRRFRIRAGNWSELRAALQAVRPDGASALAQWQPQQSVKEYLLVSDGLLTYGPEQLPAMAPDQRLFAISSAGARTDSTRLRSWSEALGGRFVALEADVDAAARALLSSPLDVQVDAGRGVQDVVIDRRSEAEGWLWLHARLAADGVPMRVRVGGGEWLALPATQKSDDGELLAGLWAQARLQQLAADRRGNREAMQRLSQQFGLVGPDTSLIVLETLEDYLRYAIRPAGKLRAEYDARFARQVSDRAAADRRRLDEVAARWKERQQWWSRSWPKDAPPQLKGRALEVASTDAAMESAPVAMLAAPAPAAPPAPMAAATEQRREASSARARRSVPAANQALDAVVVTGSAIDQAGPANEGELGIQLAAWQPDSAIAQRLRQGPSSQLYNRYLAERDAHADSSAFFLDVADLLLEQGQRELALRVLSNLAEMDLDNRHLLRVLGYRLMQADAPALAVPVFEQVLAMGQEEPQSFRDLGLALAAAGKPQQALAPLYQVVVRRWDSRFDGIALIALDELTHLVARSTPRLDTGSIDPRLLQAMPLDLRVVLSWDADNSDMDLWVTDPNGERAYYGNRLTYQGGQMSQDFTGGYGPEQFSLRNAKPGRYKVEANYFGSRQQLVTGATTLMLRLTTHWGTPKQKDQIVTMRLKDRAETVLVGEFEVK